MAALPLISTPMCFPFVPLPQIQFTFSFPIRQACPIASSQLLRSRKRSRPHTLISSDVPSLPSKKKRRLRLLLITSPLSRPFSKPATYIADHGISRIALWTKARGLGGTGLLRKAAILNRARLGGLESPRAVVRAKAQEKDLKEKGGKLEVIPVVSLAEQEAPNGDAEKSMTSRRDSAWSSLPPSPLGVSNYDALDDWHGYAEDEEDDPDQSHFPAPEKSYYSLPLPGPNKPEVVYSDFNFFDPDSNLPKDEDFDDPFSVLPPELLKASRPPSPPEETFIKAMKEEARVGGLMFFRIP